MSFTYSHNLSLDVHKVRFHIQDVEIGSGPLPEDENLSDEEITAQITIEGSWQRAVAACLERIAVAWRKFPNLESDQMGLSRSHISNGYMQDAKRWRDQYGYATEKVGVGSISPIRIDAYSTDLRISDSD